MPAFFFDLDGTLFDTRADLAATVNHTRRDIGLKEIPTETAISFVGQGASYLLEHTIPEQKNDEVRAIFRRRYVEHCCDQLKPYSGVLETLKELRRRGHRLGINTNKPNFATRAILAKFGIADFFGDAVIAGGDGFPLKPNPESLRACAARLGHTLCPEDWMIGDSHTDLNCADAAGVNSAFCTYGFGTLNGATYTVKINAFTELLSLALSHP